MNCKDFKIQIADLLTNQINNSNRLALENHLAECNNCRSALDEIKAGWQLVNTIPEVDPGPHMRSRFYTMLAKEKVRVQTHRSYRSRLNHWLNAWWPKEPTIQFGWTFGLILISLLLSGNLKTDNHEITLLKQDVQDMRQTMTVSLLQQDAATDRLQGIQLIKRVSQPGAPLLDQLMNHVNQDPSVNVRLAAVDALYLFCDHPSVRDQLSQSLQNQTSPLVQIALIDLLFDIRAKRAAETLKSLIQDQTVEPDVRQHAEQRLNTMM